MEVCLSLSVKTAGANAFVDTGRLPGTDFVAERHYFRLSRSPYPHSAVNPNQITQSLIAVLAGLRVPFVCTETHEMGEEILASYLYQVHLYQWLEENEFGSALTDSGL